MSSNHASIASSNALVSLRGRVAALASHLHATSHRRAPREIGGFPQHLLRDIGFERDWDGSIHYNREG